MFENIDNRTKLLGDDLKSELRKGSKVRIASSCFSMYAFKELKEELSQIDELKFLFTSPTFTKDTIAEGVKKEKREFYIPKQNRENSLYGSEFEIKLRNEMTLKAIAKECANWVRQKVKFKSNITNSSIPNYIGIDHQDGTTVTYNPVNGFTTTDLGYQQGNSIFTAISKTDFAEQSKFLFSMFDEVWNDKSKVEEITDNVVEMISSAYQENSPEFIYYIILYNIFSEFLDDINEDNMPNEATGFKDTKIWNMLYDFQKDGVISIINKLEKHNGCILADSVGLGKTFTALAVIAYYSLRNKSILVLCPKRLSDNWTQYCGSSNDTTNIFYEDRIRYEVLYHTDLGRVGTAHNGRDLKLVNWGNYDLVVIDESHNFRNNNPVKDKETRYDFLINHVIKAGVKTKVLMLSATPVNNRYNDLKNQLAIAYSQDYDAFEKSLDTKSNIATIFRQAQAVFNDWSKRPPNERKNKDLIDALSIDFKILLDSVTIARSRKNIAKYYNMNDIGKFPDRLPPVSCSPELTKRKDVPQYKEIYQSIKSLSMAVYGLFDFVLDSQKDKYERKYDVEIKHSGLTRSGRTSGIKRLMTVNLLKRLESSVEALIEGQANKVSLRHCPKKTNTLLTMFSPISKNRDQVFSWMHRQIESYNDPKLNWSGKIDKHEFDDCFKDIDVLIATDCISEGQNLQDCDMCINYDIHWNPVRIVQRFGRIDRIGSKNKVIQLVNFWPPLPLNEYINLTDRVKSRMTIVDQTATADDNILNPDDQMDDYREVQIKKLREGENIDLEDTNSGISISDLGLNEFRMDATEFIKTYGEPRRVPKGMHCVIDKDASRGIVSGVIYILKNQNNNVNINRQNRLHPYYLVYVDEKGEIVNNHLEVKEILDSIRVACKGRKEPLYNVCSVFNEETNDGLDMSKYSKLLEKAIESIIEVKEQSDINALFKQGSMVLSGTKIKGLDDFELLAFVVVK